MIHHEVEYDMNTFLVSHVLFFHINVSIDNFQKFLNPILYVDFNINITRYILNKMTDDFSNFFS